jgi:hypothetical protein
MRTTVPQWPYLVVTDGKISLHGPEETSADVDLGDYCGEWGSHLNESGEAVGVRLMLLPEKFFKENGFVGAKNIEMDNGDLIILFRDHRLLAVEYMPFSPVYRAALPDGREILQLSGYEWS